MEFAEKLGKKTCVPSLEHAGGRDATKTGLSILKFSANVASRRPLGLKTSGNQKTDFFNSSSSSSAWDTPPPAGGRPAGGVRGGQSPPASHDEESGSVGTRRGTRRGLIFYHFFSPDFPYHLPSITTPIFFLSLKNKMIIK